MRVATTILCLLLTSTSVALAQSPPASSFQGPNLLLTRARLDELKDAYRRGDPVVVPAWDDAVATADGYLQRQPDPIRGALKVPGYYTKDRARQQQLTRQVRGDAYAAHALAFGHALTGRQELADHAKAFVLAWVDALTHAEHGGHWWQVVTGEHRGDTPLVIAYSFPNFIYAWDLLRGLGQVTPGEHDRFSRWLRRFVDYHRSEELFHNNHHDWQALFLACAGHVLEDPALFDRALGYHRAANRVGTIARDGSLWRELVREEKAATYSLMALEAKVQLVVIAERHGVTDLRDARHGRRSLASEVLLRVWIRKPFGSLPVPKDGGTLRDGLNLLRDFVALPSSWDRFRPLHRTQALNGPSGPQEWGWLWEVAYSWWRDPRDLQLVGGPYGLTPARAYTLSYATLVFRPL